MPSVNISNSVNLLKHKIKIFLGPRHFHILAENQNLYTWVQSRTIYCAHTICWTISGIHGTCTFPPSHTCTICCANPLAVLIQEKYLVQFTITCTIPGIHGTCTFPPPHTCTICCATPVGVLIQEKYLVQCTIPGIHGTCTFPPSHTCTICCATPLAVLLKEKYLVQCPNHLWLQGQAFAPKLEPHKVVFECPHHLSSAP